MISVMHSQLEVIVVSVSSSMLKFIISDSRRKSRKKTKRKESPNLTVMSTPTNTIFQNISTTGKCSVAKQKSSSNSKANKPFFPENRIVLCKK